MSKLSHGPLADTYGTADTQLPGPAQPLPGPPRVVALVGDPRAGSLTSTLAATVARRVSVEMGLDPAESVAPAIDLGAIASRRLHWGEGPPQETIEEVLLADLVVVASTTHRGSYSGLLKLFCDALPERALDGKVAIPVMSAPAPRAALAADLHLRPLLLELGASCPTSSLVALETRLSNPAAIVSAWIGRARPTLARTTLKPAIAL
jgi:FMN reductase